MSKIEMKRAPLAYENETFVNSPDGRILRICPSTWNRLPAFVASGFWTRSYSLVQLASPVEPPPRTGWLN